MTSVSIEDKKTRSSVSFGASCRIEVYFCNPFLSMLIACPTLFINRKEPIFLVHCLVAKFQCSDKVLPLKIMRSKGHMRPLHMITNDAGYFIAIRERIVI